MKAIPLELALSLPPDYARVIDLTELTIGQQARFTAGWIDAGGNPDDWESCPWLYCRELEVVGSTPYEWGFDYYKCCKRIEERLSAFAAELAAEHADEEA